MSVQPAAPRNAAAAPSRAKPVATPTPPEATPPAAQPAIARKGLTQLKLDNGTTVLLDAIPGAEVVDIALAVKAGSLQDFPGKAGGAHLIEHMFFGGTPTRPGPQINKEMDSQGGQGNASTTLSNITFTTSVPNAEASNALSLFTDIFTHPNSDPAELAKEKSIVEQELQEGLSRGAEAYYENDRLLLGDQPLSSDVGGTVRTVRAIEPADITAYSDKYFTGKNTVVVLSGDPSTFDVDLLKKTIGKLPAGTAVDNSKLFQGFRKGALVEVVPDETTQQTSLSITFPGVKKSDPLRPAAQVLGTLMGGGLSSRLNNRLRERDQITYGINASNSSGAEYGAFEIGTSLSNKNLRFGMTEIIDELRDAITDISDTEVERARRQTMNQLTMQGAKPGVAISSAISTALTGRPATTARELREAVSKVTTEQVRAAAKQVFDFNEMKVLAHGNLTDSAPIHQGLADAKVGVKLIDVPFDEQRYIDKVAP